MVRAFAAQSVDLGSFPQVKSYQKTLENGIHSCFSSIEDLVFPSKFFSVELQNQFIKKWICDFISRPIFIKFSKDHA